MSDARIEALQEAIREYASERGYVTRWALVLEVERSDGAGRMLMHRARDAAADRALSPWDEAMLHRATMLIAERDLLGLTRPPESEE